MLRTWLLQAESAERALKSGYVIRSCSAASAEQCSARFVEPVCVARELFRCAAVDSLPIHDLREAGIRLDRERHFSELAESLKLCKHLLRPCAAVEPESIDAHTLHDYERSTYVSTGQCPAVLITCEGYEHRLVADVFDCEQSGSRIRHSHDGLYHIHVYTGFFHRLSLLMVDVIELIESQVTERREEFARSRDVSRDKSILSGTFDSLLRDLYKPPVEIPDLVEYAVFLELYPVGPESRRIYDVAPGLDIFSLQLYHHLRMLEHPCLGALAAVISSLLELSPVGSVQYKRKIQFHNTLRSSYI